MTDHKIVCLFFFKQKTAYEMRISDWSSDVCSSDLYFRLTADRRLLFGAGASYSATTPVGLDGWLERRIRRVFPELAGARRVEADIGDGDVRSGDDQRRDDKESRGRGVRSEEHTSELQSLMRISYAVFCLKKKKKQPHYDKI